MTAHIKKTVSSLKGNVRKYRSTVEGKLSKRAGAKPDAVFVYSAAKYYPTLKKLASK